MKRLRRRIDPSWDQMTVEEQVRFYDVDSERMVWHGHYLRYVEVARDEYFKSRGLDYDRVRTLGLSAPVVRCHLEYRHPACFGDRLAITIAHVPSDDCLLGLLCEIRRLPDRRLLCAVEGVQAFCDAASGALIYEWPPALAAFRAAIAPRTSTDREMRDVAGC